MKFLDIVENGYASQNNPLRTGIVTEVRGKTIRCTNGRGDYWNATSNNERLEIVGNLREVFNEMLAALMAAQGESRHIASEGNSCEGEDCVACKINAAITRAEVVKKGF